MSFLTKEQIEKRVQQGYEEYKAGKTKLLKQELDKKMNSSLFSGYWAIDEITCSVKITDTALKALEDFIGDRSKYEGTSLEFEIESLVSLANEIMSLEMNLPKGLWNGSLDEDKGIMYKIVFTFPLDDDIAVCYVVDDGIVTVIDVYDNGVDCINEVKGYYNY